MKQNRLSPIRIVAILFGLMVTALPLQAQVQDASVSPENTFPFAPPTTNTFSLPDPQEGYAEISSRGNEQSIVSVTASHTVSPSDGANYLEITAQIAPTWHIYSVTQPSGGPLPTVIKILPAKTWRLAGKLRAVYPPDRQKEPAYDNLMVETHHDKATWRAPIAIAPGVDPTKMTIQGSVRVQACSPSNCRPPEELPFVATFAASEPASNAAIATTPKPATPSIPEEKTASIASAAAPPTRTATPHEEQLPRQASPKEASTDTKLDSDNLQVMDNDELKQSSLPMVMALGFLGGLILNLMPCVLPVIGLKVLSFVEQAGHSRRQALMLNLWYSLGMILVFLLLATLSTFVGLGWGQLFSFAWFNITLAAVVFVMGLSFLGVWEIPIPGFVGSGKLNDYSSKEGALGAFSKGILTTIMATPCSGPFLASALAWSVGQPPVKTYTVFLSVGVGMASPYLTIGVFPKLLRFLPKPGAWMDTFKQAMGFVLLGTVAYLLTLLGWIYIIPTVAFLFGLWAACWWIGRTPITATFAKKAGTWLSAAAFAGIMWFVTFGWLTDVMASRFERDVQIAIAKNGGTPTVEQNGDHLPWRPFSSKAFDELIAAENTIMVDFTADWCMTCKALEKFVLNTPRISETIRQHGVVTLKADWTHAEPEVTKMLEQLGSKQVPVVAIFPAGKANQPIVLRGSYTQETLQAALEKAIR